MESGRSIFTKKRLSDINAIDRDGKYEADKRRLLVDLWEERCGDDATYDAMITAMLKAGKMNEATNLCKLLQDTAHGFVAYQSPYHTHSPASLTWNWLKAKVTTSVLYLLPKQIRKRKKFCFSVAALLIILLQTLIYTIGTYVSCYIP